MLLTSFVMQLRETAIRLRSQVALEDAQAHGGLIVCLVVIRLGVLVPGLCGLLSVAANEAARTRSPSVDWRPPPRSPLRHPGDAAAAAGV